jgi:hypothetical protein
MMLVSALTMESPVITVYRMAPNAGGSIYLEVLTPRLCCYRWWWVLRPIE